MQKKTIFDTIFRSKPAIMLVQLKVSKDKPYVSTLAKDVDCTYAHVVKVLQKMERNGLVTFQKQGRLKILTLTKKGTDVADMIYKIKDNLR